MVNHCNRRWLHIGLLGLAALVLGGCASGPRPAMFGAGFDAWVDDELGPYVAEQLATDPRLKRGPVLLVGFDGDDVTPAIDRLTEDVRGRLFDRLVATPGVDLAWRPAGRPWQHHRTLAAVECGLREQPTIYVGLDVRETASGDFRAAVRALDLQDGSWVSGFGITWQGYLDADQLSALTDTSADPYLRGLRPLPFDADQRDLAASYLAHNLSCLLAQSDRGRLRVHVARPGHGAPDSYRGIVTLVKRYVNQFQEVDVVETPRTADALVDSELVQIDGDLWQAWLGVRLISNGGQRVSGADTPAYLRLPPQAVAVAAPVVREPMIRVFSAVVPPSQHQCSRSNPFAHGSRSLEPGEILPMQGCFAVEGRVPAGSDAYLVAAESEGQWSRMVPSNCQDGRYRSPSRLAAHGDFRFPRTGAIDVTGRGGSEQLYLIVAEGAARGPMARAIRRLPDACTGTGAGRDPRPAIRQVLEDYPAVADMRALEVFHSR